MELKDVNITSKIMHTNKTTFWAIAQALSAVDLIAMNSSVQTLPLTRWWHSCCIWWLQMNNFTLGRYIINWQIFCHWRILVQGIITIICKSWLKKNKKKKSYKSIYLILLIVSGRIANNIDLWLTLSRKIA